MQTIGQTLKAELNKLNPSQEITETENYDHIQLTTQESDIAISQAKKEKYFRLKKEEWAARIAASPKWYVPTADDLKSMLMETKSKNGNDFVIESTEHEWLINQLCYYFSNDPRFTFDPQKGIMLMGQPGCGKTHLMNFFCKNPKASYAIPTCKVVVERYVNGWSYDGVEKIAAYSGLKKAEFDHKWDQKHLGFCFGDFGSEVTEASSYGNKRNVIEEIIFNRYEANIPFIYTHFTTNLNPEEIETKYGSRLRDRLKEMCNVFLMKNKSFRA